MKVSKNTLYSYLAMLEDALLIFMVRKFGHSFRKGDFSINKLYLCDTGFAKLSETLRNVGHKMENVVFLELERRKEPLSEIFYWRNYEQEEVDFVVRDGPAVVQLIQACYEINDDVKKREVRSLIKAGAETRCKNLTIITYDYEAIEKYEKQHVKFIPLWKWLLME